MGHWNDLLKWFARRDNQIYFWSSYCLNVQKLAYLNYPYEESLKYFGNFFKVARLMLLETLQHDEVLPDNCQLKTFEICSVKLLLRLLAPFLFKWSLLLFRWLALIFLHRSVRKKISVTHFFQRMVDFASLFI